MPKICDNLKTIFISFLLIVALNLSAKAERMITAEDVNDKTRGMWLAQLIANAAGRPTEGYFQATPNPADSVPWVIKQTWDADDDTDIEYIAMHILETNGLDCDSQQIADQWPSHITNSGIYIANRQALELMRYGYLPPQTGSRTYNEHWYSIDSQITTEVLGAISPGLVQSAIDLTGKFAHISNEGFPVHAAQLYTAMYANAFFESNVVNLVTEGLNAIPTTSRTHQVASDVFNWYIEDINDGDPNWRQTRQKLADKYYGSQSYGRYYLWVESTVNTGATILAILYGQGDFKQTAQIGVLAGWDCDCNPATAAGLIGIIDGYTGLPADLTNPAVCGDVYKNVYRPYLPDANIYLPQYDSITNIANRLTSLAEQNILANAGYITFDPNKTYHIPETDPVIPEPQLPDPNEPNGLVAEAINAGFTVTPTAAVARYDTSYDRYNLYAIINGITNNSYNGHRPYYSYISDPGQRPQHDWYQLNFSQPVKFVQLKFYEGDIVWGGINTYYKDDDAKGGFFNDLTVQILRDGKFITPADLTMTPALDRYKMYQTITFDFAPTAGDAIKIIGTAGGTRSYTTIMELETYGDTDPGLFVASTEIENGLPQRSCLTTIKIQFNRDVTITKTDIEIVGSTYGTVLEMDAVGFEYDDLTYWLTLTLPASLPDDTYQLKLNCVNIIDQNSTALLDDDKNPHDGFYTIEFHQLFGDADGSAAIDTGDLRLFYNYWLDDPADTALDSNDDDYLNFFDFASFARNWRFTFQSP